MPQIPAADKSALHAIVANLDQCSADAGSLQRAIGRQEFALNDILSRITDDPVIPEPPAPPTVGSVTVTPSALTLTVGESATLTAVVKDVNGNVLTDRAVLWQPVAGIAFRVDSAGKLVAQEPSFGTLGLYAWAICDGVASNNVTVVVNAKPAPLPVPSSGPDLSGMTRVVDQSFESLVGERTVPCSIVTDLGEPISPATALEMVFLDGWASGGTPFQYQKRLPHYRRAYSRLSFRLDPNHVGDQSGVQKLFDLWCGETASRADGWAKVVVSAQGSGSSALLPSLNVQNAPDNVWTRPPNVVPDARILRGKWHTLELMAELDVYPVYMYPDRLRLWLDKQLVSDFSVKLLNTGENKYFTYAEACPIWGGNKGSLARAQSIRFGHYDVWVGA